MGKILELCTINNNYTLSNYSCDAFSNKQKKKKD